jgi:predicted O-methyltransferase YrrM
MIRWLKKKILNSKYYLRPLQDPSKFEFFQSKGLHVVPNHFYFPVPDTSKFSDATFTRQYHWEGIPLYEEEQTALLQQFIRDYKEEYRHIPYERTAVPHEFFWNNGGFQCLDAVSLYGMIRRIKPKRVLEVGGGNTTMLSANALLKNRSEGFDGELTTIEPYPWPIHRNGFPGLGKLIDRPVEQLPADYFSMLGENDILFIDTSHISTIGSDVTYYFMELIPMLRKGVIIHIHDIFLPEEYPKNWVMKDHLFYNEQYLLRAFLSFNHAFKVLFAGRYLQLRHPGLMAEAFDFYPGEITVAGSFWFQRVQ